MTTPNPFAALMQTRRGPAAAAAQTTPAGAAPAPETQQPQAQLAAGADTPVETQPQEPVAVGGETPVKLHVLSSTGHGRFDQILAGVVGTEDEQGRFVLDPDYSRLAYLFTLASSSQLPIVRDEERVLIDQSTGEVEIRRGERTLEVSLPPSLAKAFKANLVEMAGAHWGRLYESVGSFVPGAGLGGSMLQNERDTVARNVATYAAEGGMTQWDVPLVYTTSVLEENPAARGTTEATLLAMAGGFRNAIVDVTRDPVPHVAPAAPATQQAGEGAVETPADESPAIPAEWAAHTGGLELTVEGVVTVRAANADDAARLATSVLYSAMHIPNLRQSVRPRAVSIQGGVTLQPTEVEVDDDDYDRYR